MTDADRERLIEAYRVVVELDPSERFKILAWQSMSSLIAERSPQQVEQMERRIFEGA